MKPVLFTTARFTTSSGNTDVRDRDRRRTDDSGFRRRGFARASDPAPCCWNNFHGDEIALEWFWNFQIRRRKDLQEIDKELTAIGAQTLAWDGDSIVRQIRSGELRLLVYLYRFEGFLLLRGMMYLIAVGLFILTVVTIIAACR